MIHEEEIQEIQIKLTEIKLQLGRLISDAESEKEVRKDRNRDIDKRLLDLELWKSNLQGRLIVTIFIGGGFWTGFIAWLFSMVGK